MDKKWNNQDKIDSPISRNAMLKVYEYVVNTYSLPSNMRFMYYDKLSFEQAIINRNSINLIDNYFLSHKVQNGKKDKYSELVPDSGCITIDVLGSHCQITHHLYVCCGEMKYQGDNQGNAIERSFKNANAFNNTFNCCGDITPYIVCCRGASFKSEFEKNKLRVGCGFEVPNLNIKTIKEKDYFGNNINRRRYGIIIEEETFDEKKLYDAFVEVAKQSMDYYMTKIPNIRRKSC